MADPRRVTGPFLDVLEVFVLEAGSCTGELHGWAIMKATKRSGPTTYGVLDKLEDMGWITGDWESENPEPGKPRRRLYRLTPTGTSGAMQLLSERRPKALSRVLPAAPGPVRPGWARILRHGEAT